MTSDPHKSAPAQEKKTGQPTSPHWGEDRHLEKTRRLLRSTSILYPLLLALLLIVGTVFLVITVTRRNTCRHLREGERVGTSLGALPNDHTAPWVWCKKTNLSSACACPASFVHSKTNPSHCVPSHSRCLHSCRHNEHCACYHIADAQRCRDVSSHWMKHQMKIGALEHVRHPHPDSAWQQPWWIHSAEEIEHNVVHHRPHERMFFSADRQTAITVDVEQDDYLLNERWTKIGTNTTEQHVVYTQLDPQTHTCRMSSIYQNGTVRDGPDHACPGITISPPYYLGVACESVLVLWHGGMQSKTRRSEEWTVSRHHFEASIPRLPILLDPFHRYYSLYDDLMVEVKDLNGEVLGQWFTEVHHPTKFEFSDHHGTIRIANRTHMQLITSTDENAWLDV